MLGLRFVVELLAWSLGWEGDIATIDRNQAVLGPIVSTSSVYPRTLMSGGLNRSYLLSVPASYSSRSSWPLIVDFHGRNGSPEGQRNNSLYYKHQAGQKYFVAYPLGCLGNGSHGGPPKTAWQGAPYANKSCNDLLFTEDLINATISQYSIDKTRIYASGKSNGGGFVDTIACSNTGDLFAAFAMAAAALYTDTFIKPVNCVGGRPRPILEAHGTADTVIPVNGRRNFGTPNIARWVARWGERDGCDPDEDRTIEATPWGMKTTYSCNNISGIVQQYRIHGLGHCWPSKMDNTDTPAHNGTCEVKTVGFTSYVLDFFAAWHK